MDKKKESTTFSWMKAIAIVVAFVLVFPLWLKIGKDKVYEKNGINIYASNKTSSTEVSMIVDSAIVLLNKKDIEIKEEMTIIFYDTRKEFKVRNLFISSGALAMNWWPLPYISFAPVDMASDRQYSRKEILNERPISSVIAHELTHTYQAEHLNIFGYKYHTILDKWKIEGMAEYISNSSSLPLKKGLELFMKDAERDEIASLDIKGEYFYFKSHLKAEYLLSVKKISELDFWKKDFDQHELEEEIREAINSSQYIPHWKE